MTKYTLAAHDQVVTMSSLDISGLVGSRHDSVKRAIERLSATGVISQPPMVDGEKSANGVVTKVYVFEGSKESVTVS
jgi:phage regulator Rha-like protein